MMITCELVRKHWKNSLKMLFSLWVIGSALPHIWGAITHPGDLFRGLFALCVILVVLSRLQRAKELKQHQRECELRRLQERG
jgi:hypothetical protein